MNKIIHGDCLKELKKLPKNSVDLLCTDPPYGYSFMGKDWDKAVPSVEVWQECLRVLKPGAFAFIMSAPRSDVLSRMIVRIEDAGFRVDFSPIYWTYASGFPKAMNIGKMVDKRNGRDETQAKELGLYMKECRLGLGLSQKQLDQVLGTNTQYSWYEGRKRGNQLPTQEHYNKLKSTLSLDSRYDALIAREEAERAVIGKSATGYSEVMGAKANGKGGGRGNEVLKYDITTPSTSEAKALDGSYGGFQPKPAVEVVIVAMKPLSEKTYVDQAMKNGKGVTWLTPDCAIPSEERDNTPMGSPAASYGGFVAKTPTTTTRFPANLLVQDNVLADYSRYFDLDAWAKTLPFLITPKASKGEKNEGVDTGQARYMDETRKDKDAIGCNNPRNRSGQIREGNFHPTVKPLKLMSYLITLGSRHGDVVLEPFAGSGTTCLAAKNLGRTYIGIEREAEYVKIAEARLKNSAPVQPTLMAAE